MARENKSNLQGLLDNYRGLRIPEVQRDYVLGAGGQGFLQKDKLQTLLGSMLFSCRSSMDFDFSCFVVNETDEGILNIYDGQQRIVTLFLTLLVTLKREGSDTTKYKDWLQFVNRPEANEVIGLLTSDLALPEIMKMEDDVVKGFSSFSMFNLIHKMQGSEFAGITSSFLLGHVKFDKVVLSEQSEAEQFFLDLNAGLYFQEYELYKAVLADTVNKMARENVRGIKALTLWSHRMDNEWLNFFCPFATEDVSAEELEVNFLKYCFNMCCKERCSYISSPAENIPLQDICRVYSIMEQVVTLQANFHKWFKPGEDYRGVLHKFAYRPVKSEPFRFGQSSPSLKRQSLFWNLNCERYSHMLFTVICTLLGSYTSESELNDDILLWTYISTLGSKKSIQNAYLRLLKVIMNNNYIENHAAYYASNAEGRYLCYCKYVLYGIPQYYGTHFNTKDLNTSDAEAVCRLLWVINGSLAEQFLKETGDVSVHNYVSSKLAELKWEDISSNVRSSDSTKDKDAFSRISYINSHRRDLDATPAGVESLGFIQKGSNYTDDYFYTEKVKLTWPARKGDIEPIRCRIALRNEVDKYLSEFDEEEHTVASSLKTSEPNLYACYWLQRFTVDGAIGCYKLCNRTTDNAKTYNSPDGGSPYADYYYYSGVEKYFKYKGCVIMRHEMEA